MTQMHRGEGSYFWVLDDADRRVFMSEKFVGGTDRGADAVIPTHELGMAFPQRRGEGVMMKYTWCSKSILSAVRFCSPPFILRTFHFRRHCAERKKEVDFSFVGVHEENVLKPF